MTASSARSAIGISATVVAAMYFYRRFTETGEAPTSAEVSSQGLISLGRFATGFGIAFGGLALISGPAPQLAGSMALLILFASVLSNGQAIGEKLEAGVAETKAEQAASRTHPAAARASGHRGAGTIKTTQPGEPTR